MYHDLQGGIISKEEYIRFSGIYAEQEKAAEQAAKKLKQEAEAVFCRRMSANTWLNKFARCGEIQGMERSGVLSLVVKITVHENCRIEIMFRYRDEYRAVSETGALLSGAEGDRK